MMVSRYAPIGEYGVIGDLDTVALVGMDGSIDFLCLPYFDSPSVFAALVDSERGGRFQIAPLLGSAARKQLYLPDTNVLLTRFLDADGVAEVSDFMPVEDAGQAHRLVRRAKTVRGEVRFQMRCDPRFDYARATHTAERRSDTEVLFFGRSGDGELVLRLRSSVAMRLENGTALAEFTLHADTSAWFVLEVVLRREPSASEQPDYESDAFKQTVNFWRRWVARSTYGGRWREMVNRSALTLKLLTSRQHGSIVAAPTFGLPETIGSGRNWDYRYTWIRDSSFTLYGLMRLGYTHEAAAFMRWVTARCGELAPDGLAPLFTQHRVHRNDGWNLLSHHPQRVLEAARVRAAVGLPRWSSAMAPLDRHLPRLAARHRRLGGSSGRGRPQLSRRAALSGGAVCKSSSIMTGARRVGRGDSRGGAKRLAAARPLAAGRRRPSAKRFDVSNISLPARRLGTPGSIFAVRYGSCFSSRWSTTSLPRGARRRVLDRA